MGEVLYWKLELPHFIIVHTRKKCDKINKKDYGKWKIDKKRFFHFPKGAEYVFIRKNW